MGIYAKSLACETIAVATGRHNVPTDLQTHLKDKATVRRHDNGDSVIMYTELSIIKMETGISFP